MAVRFVTVHKGASEYDMIEIFARRTAVQNDLMPDDRDAFRAGSKPLMKYTNWLSFNLRCIALFCALFARMPWLYFAFELIVLNAMLVYMMWRHEKMCRAFTIELQNGKY